MPKTVTVNFAPLALPKSGSVVVFVGADGRPSAQIGTLLGEEVLRAVARAATIERFKGKSGTSLSLLYPSASLEKLIVIGTANEGEPVDLMMLGGQVASKLANGQGCVMLLIPGIEMNARHSAEFALGARLSVYKFDRYKTKKEGDE